MPFDGIETFFISFNAMWFCISILIFAMMITSKKITDMTFNRTLIEFIISNNSFFYNLIWKIIIIIESRVWFEIATFSIVDLMIPFEHMRRAGVGKFVYKIQMFFWKKSQRRMQYALLFLKIRIFKMLYCHHDW